MKIKSTLIGFILVFIMLFNQSISQANNNINIIVNYRYLITDVNPIIEDNYCLIPLRALSEALGFKVEWNNNDQKITIYKESDIIEFQIGNLFVINNGKSDFLPIAPKIINNRTMVPLRYISESLNMKVNYAEMSEEQYIWITDFDILDDIDVEINDNFFMLTNDPAPYYRLRDNKSTARGIKLGDKLSTVKDKYGTPMRVDEMDNDLIRLCYISKYMPNTGSGSALYFEFKDETLIRVELDPPN